VPDEQVVVGCVGRLSVATRGQAGPGEVLLRVRGGIEAYLAWSDAPLARGAGVLVVGLRSPRTVEVVTWDDPQAALPPLTAQRQELQPGQRAEPELLSDDPHDAH
jgi:hypothetical protein